MGLAEQIRAGARLTRDTITLPASAVSNASLGGASIILSISADKECRVRLYDTEASRDNAGEIDRPFGDTNISASVALVGDFIISGSGRQFVDPAVYSVADSYASPSIYYRISEYQGASVPSVSITRYLLEDNTLGNNIGRDTITVPTATSLGASAMVDGTIDPCPRTFLLVSASVATTTEPARIRLYSKLAAIDNEDEKNRAFHEPASASAFLIVDTILTGSETTYFSPKIVGANLDTMGTDLNITRQNNTLIEGTSEIYYILENLGASTQTIDVSIHTYSLED
jgi:hypothetical protein